ncbi:MAG: sensor domain-containing diguanylate cyclase [Candidatus Obscuribacterales bacterium]|nr:sensor domain-containing diguanylate cyclase [Candidatus Obscuribacterales bacterium]
MTNDGNLLQRYIGLQKSLLSSLRLKDVLDATVVQFSELAGGAKVAVFLSDNESMSFKLMAARGYQEYSLDQLRVVSFSVESLLKYVVQKRAPASTDNPDAAPGLSAAIMKKEGSAGQIALPLISANLLVGAVLIDVGNSGILSYTDFYNEVAEVTALSVANSILFGRSEYERERLSTLYKTSCAFSGSMLQINEVLQIAADTALVLGNTPCCAILLLDEGQNNFHLAAFKGLDGASLNDFDMSTSDSLAGSCLRNARTEYLGEGGRPPYGMPAATGGSVFHSVLAVPIIFNQKPLGVLEVFSTDARAFHREQVELLESLCVQVSTALNNALTHQTAASQSILDVHTGLYNRLHFEDALTKEVERSDRHKHELGVMFIDIDHLGQINEHLGQEKGDEAIRHVAGLVKSTLRDIDIACRYGGEEIAVILPETPNANVLEVADRVRMAVRETTAAGVGTITVSIGVSAYPGIADSAQSLIVGAEQALDIAKFEGRDRVKVFSPSTNLSPGDIPWEQLANQARMAVISERQGRLQSRLTIAPEYASWLTASPNMVGKKRASDS